MARKTAAQKAADEKAGEEQAVQGVQGATDGTAGDTEGDGDGGTEGDGDGTETGDGGGLYWGGQGGGEDGGEGDGTNAQPATDSSTEGDGESTRVPTIAEVGTDTDLERERVGTDMVNDGKAVTLADGVVQSPQIAHRSTGVPGGPLEAPATPLAIKVSTVEQTHMTPGALGAALVGQGDRLLDAATGEAPDPDAMFINAYGSVYVCQVRLMEDVSFDGGTPSRRLVMPVGQTVSAETAQKFRSLVQAQAALAAAESESESDES